MFSAIEPLTEVSTNSNLSTFAEGGILPILVGAAENILSILVMVAEQILSILDEVAKVIWH